jgi:mono/diheme cytochrome c family protein
MSKTIRFHLTLAAALLLSVAMGAAQSGQATFKAKCQMCHGAAGMADSGAGKAMHIKPVTDPEVKQMSEAQMISAVSNGMGKMQPYKNSLTSTQIKDAVAYFRSFIK